jgi:hypothetical protein
MRQINDIIGSILVKSVIGKPKSEQKALILKYYEAGLLKPSQVTLAFTIYGLKGA